MLELSNKTNLIEQKNYKYDLQDVSEPNLYREVYSYTDVPRVAFNHRRVPLGCPKDIWITDTSLRDGQQSVEPYTVDQIVQLYKYMSRLGGPYGIIRQTEFFVYSKKDREAIARCQEFYLGKQDAEQIKQMDNRFHRIVYKLSGSSVFYDTLVPLHKKIQKYRRVSVENKSRAAASVAEHKKIYEAIAAKNAADAEKYTTEHVINAYRHIIGKD